MPIPVPQRVGIGFEFGGVLSPQTIGNNGLFVVYDICFGEGLFGNCFEREIDLFDFVCGLYFCPPNVDIVQVLGIMVEVHVVLVLMEMNVNLVLRE